MSDYDSAISALFKLRAPQVPHWTESYKNVTSLRDLMDARRIREQQLQLGKLKLEEEQRQAEDEQRTRRILSTFPITEKTNLTDLLRAGLSPRVATQIDTELRQRGTAAMQQKTADLTQAAAVRKAEQERQERVLGMQAGLLQEHPAAGYQQGATSYETPEMRRAAESDVRQMQGLGVEGQPTMVMPTAAQFPTALGAAVGPKEAQAFMAAQATRQEAADRAAAAASQALRTKTKEDLEIREKKAQRAAQLAPNVTEQTGYDELLTVLDPEDAKKYPAKFSTIAIRNIARGGMTPDQAARAEAGAVPNTEFEAAYAATDPNLPPDQRAKQALKNLNQSKLASRPQVNIHTAQDRTALVDAVIENPAILDRLTPTVQGQIAPELAKRGFTGWGAKLSEGAITKISDSKAAIASVADLRNTIKENEKYFGPIAGWQAKWPTSEAKKVQAKIDVIRQRVGKALEGGVLRKEDEEKYRNILATIMDVPELAVYKMEMLEQLLDRDMGIFIQEQRSAGRRVEMPSAQTPTASPKTNRKPLSSFEK